jgi:O-antigen/teichoic acid export membrane protein
LWWNSSLAKKIIPRSEFAKNVGLLSGGSAIAQGLNILTIPLFSRLYTPKDFGIMALFITISTLIGTISNGRYELTILLPKKDKSAINLTFLGILIAISISILTLIILLPFRGTFASLLGETSIKNLLLLLPLDIFLYGTYNSISHWCNRKKLYKIMSIEAIIHVLTITIFRGALYFILPNGTGLILSYLAGRIASFIIMIIIGFRTIDMTFFDTSVIKALAIKYKKFPTFSTLSAFTNTLSRNITSITMPSVFSSQNLGYYSMSQSILGLPSSLIATSISKIFSQEASVEKIKTGKSERTFKKTLKRLIIISIPLFLSIIVFIRPVIGLFLGDQWTETGKYIQLLVPLFAVQFVSSALSGVMPIFQKMKQAWIRDILLLVAAVSPILLAYFFSLRIETFLILHTTFSALAYFFSLLYYRKVAYNKT